MYTPKKNSLYFRKWNLFVLILKKFRKRKPRKKVPYISGNGNPKISSQILGSGTFQSKPQRIKKIHAIKNALCFKKWNFLTLRLKNFLYFLQRNIFLYFLKKAPYIFWPGSPKVCSEKISYTVSKKSPIFRKRKPQRNPYISGNETFLYFRK